jgi:photosystem I P700 chlorophyll a apoprotein A2
LFTGRSTCTAPPYAFLAQDFTTQALFIHITNILLVYSGAFAHRLFFFIRDYDPEANRNVLSNVRT